MSSDSVFVFGQSCFDFLRCFSNVLFVAISTGEHINGVASVWDADRILMFSEVVRKLVRWFMCYLYLMLSEQSGRYF